MPSQPLAKEGDAVVGVDTHIIMIPSPTGPVPTPLPCPFSGKLADGLSGSTFVMNRPAAIENAVAKNDPKHIPTGGAFQKQPSDQGVVEHGSQKVFIDGKGAVRNGHTAKTCADPEDAPNGTVIAEGTVFVGD